MEHIKRDEMWESGCLRRLAEANQLMAFKHYGFWKCMDTLRDKKKLEEMWMAGDAAWKIW